MISPSTQEQFQTYGQQASPAGVRRTRQVETPGVVVEMSALGRAWGLQEDRPMQCVSSGYLSGGSSCRESVPAGVVTAAWARQLARTGVRESRFFTFAWQGAVWLAYGVSDGQIRGVYCPTHRAERDARTTGCEAGESAQPARAASTGAGCEAGESAQPAPVAFSA